MKKVFYMGLLGLALFEIANVYFIMPMPGSQRMDSIDLAYFLYSSRWAFRITFTLFILIGAMDAFSVRRKWLPALAVLPVLVIVYSFNFQMTADHMFLQPENLVFRNKSDNTLTDSSIVVAVSHQGEAKAYPIRMIQYHHQVRDTVGGKPVMITYCNVCRTGRVFEPSVQGKPETFRLVGMDHFNAMFEDRTTGSWWRQANGEAITGELKGTMLPELESNQVSLRMFFMLYPSGTVMQTEEKFRTRYDSTGRYEKGRSKGTLTRTDSLSWKDKSWVVGIDLGGKAKAYDWLDLKKLRIIHDTIGEQPVVVIISDDDQSFAAFKANDTFLLRNDSLIGSINKYNFMGKAADGSGLVAVHAYQEFWHSWQTFHPNTVAYKPE